MTNSFTELRSRASSVRSTSALHWRGFFCMGKLMILQSTCFCSIHFFQPSVSIHSFCVCPQSDYIIKLHNCSLYIQPAHRGPLFPSATLLWRNLPLPGRKTQCRLGLYIWHFSNSYKSVNCNFPENSLLSFYPFATSSVCLRQPDALLINSETKRAAKRQPESEREAPVTVIKMSEEQGRHGDWAKGVGGERAGGSWAGTLLLCSVSWRRDPDKVVRRKVVKHGEVNMDVSKTHEGQK